MILEEIQQAIQWKQYHPKLQEQRFIGSMLVMRQNCKLVWASEKQKAWVRNIHEKIFRTQKAEKGNDEL